MLRVCSVICHIEIIRGNGFSERGGCPLLCINDVGLRFLFHLSLLDCMGL